MDIISQLQRDEGFSNHIYIDTVGKRTIGYGHNLDAKPIPWITLTTRLTQDQAMQILVQDIADTKTALFVRIPWTSQLDDVRQGVLVNMTFNMGILGLLKFKHALVAFQVNDWVTAAAEMKNSSWYVQVGQRADRLVTQTLTGIWQ